MNNTSARKRKPFTGKGRSGVSKKKVSGNFDPNQFIKKSQVAPVEEEKPVPEWKYDDISIHTKLKENLSKRGYVYPTPIQEKSIHYLIEGRDLLGIANTGTGKTAAFLIPIIDRLMSGLPSVSLVVVPTRELALQVEEEFNAITKGLGLRVASFIGGKSILLDKKKLQHKNHLIIGTPGRLLDLTNQGLLKLNTISTLVLDEFDRMLDMGFVHDIKKLLKGLTQRKQTVFFSATLDKKQQPLINEILRNPVEVKVSSGNSSSERVDQNIVRVKEGENKFQVLLDLISAAEFEKVLIFAETKRVVNVVGKKLNQSGVKTELIHGNKSQNYRINALDQFNKGKIKVLVATDIAARGLDVPNVTHVINYQVPRSMDSYIHRIGRTGRAGKTGKAFTFVD